MIRIPSSGPRIRFTASATNLMESISRPESVSSRIAISGFSIAICRISARFFSPPEKRVVHVQHLELALQHRAELFRCHLLRLVLSVVSTLGVQSGAEEVGHRDPGHHDRILESEEHAQTRAFVRFQLEDVLALEQNGAAIDRVAGMTHQGVRQRRLAGPVRAHHGVDLALGDGERYALEDLAALHTGAQVFDLEISQLSFRSPSSRMYSRLPLQPSMWCAQPR